MIIMPSKKGQRGLGSGEGGRNALMFSRSGGSKPSDKLFDIRTMKSTFSCHGEGSREVKAARCKRLVLPQPLTVALDRPFCVSRAVNLSGPRIALIVLALFLSSLSLRNISFPKYIRARSLSLSLSPSCPPPRRQVVNEIAASGAARHAKLMKVCALRAFRSRLPSSGAKRTRASTYDDAFFLSFSLLCSLLMREHSRRDSRLCSRGWRMRADRARAGTKNPARAEINARMNDKQMRARKSLVL